MRKNFVVIVPIRGHIAKKNMPRYLIFAVV